MVNKESILEQIKIVESNVSRLKLLVETDLHSVPNTDVVQYCCKKASIQIENIAQEFNTSQQIEPNKGINPPSTGEQK